MADDSTPCPSPTWSSAREALVRLHHALGLSAAASADLIGGVSRNAVISKRRRMGLVGANPLHWRDRAAAAASYARSPLARLAWPTPPELHACREPLPFMDWPAPPDANPKRLADREPGECAWPLGPANEAGDYRTLFCCAPAERGRSLCAAHRARARVPAQAEP